MQGLAKLWTWIGQTFTPMAIAWAVYVRGGLSGEHLEDGVLISRGYWGLLITLVSGTSLVMVATLYILQARRLSPAALIPPNTTFDETAKSGLISRGTALVFALAIVGGLVLFAGRYADSRIYKWDGSTPLTSGFWSSRLAAFQSGCDHGPCYAVAQRLYNGHSVSGVNEYVLYLTDGILVIATVALIGSITFLAICLTKTRPQLRYGR